MPLESFVAQHPRLFVLTGAGVSTASGIPDYRDQHGDWKHQRPMEYRDFVGTHRARQRYWSRSFIGWRRFVEAHPNSAHRALARLEQAGRIARLVTQNVDGLHQLAGSRDPIELHGSLARVSCLDCGRALPRAAMQQALAERNPTLEALTAELAPDGDARLGGFDERGLDIPACAACGGVLKPEVVFFGEGVPPARVEQSYAALEAADAMLVVGSSLMVYSGYRFARRARERGIPLAAINLGTTRADDFLDLKITADCGEVLSKLLN